MNYAQSFEEFSKGLGSTDLMVYGGAALILFVLFKDQLTPLKEWVVGLYSSLVNKTSNIKLPTSSTTKNNDANFLNLVSSWKNTRDLAEKAGCAKAVEILDTAFPHLGPHNCVVTENKQ